VIERPLGSSDVLSMEPLTRRGWTAAAVLASTLIGTLALAAPAAARTQSSDAVLRNSGFEQGLSGWRARSATLRVVRRGSGYAAEVALRPGRGSRTFSISRAVARNPSATMYTATASVRAARGRRVCLRVRELVSHRTAGRATRCLLSTGRWQSFRPLSYRLRRVDARLRVVVFARGARPGVRFRVDTVALRTAARLGAPAATPPDVGVHFHALWNDYTGEQRIQVLDKLVAAGVRWVRIDLMWSYTEIAPGFYNPGTLQGLDFILSEAAKRGLKVLIVTFGTPSWANGGRATNVPPSDPAFFARYASWLASTYRGRVAAWQVWNEPNWTSFWAGSAADYAALLRTAHTAFKAADPDALVVFGGVAGNDDRWLRNAYAAGVHGAFDVMATHPYPSPSDTAPEVDETMARTLIVHELMKANGDGDKPVWFTEFGWSSHANHGGERAWERGVSEEQQANYLVRTAKLAQTHFPYVREMFWYNERNRADSNAVENNFGLLTRDLAEKPVYTALKTFLTRIGR
jgi:hypothetical protein